MSLQAGDLTIAVPYFGCNKNCPYCVSQMTGNFSNHNSFYKNLRKAKKVADAYNAFTVMITGKGEPTYSLSYGHTLQILDEFSEYITELQTNGLELLSNKQNLIINDLKRCELNVLAISVDSISDIKRFSEVLETTKYNGMANRITFNLSLCSIEDENIMNGTLSKLDFIKELINTCLENNVDQLTLKRLSIPYGKEHTKQGRWIQNNAMGEDYDKIASHFKHFVRNDGTYIRKLNHGPLVYDLFGLSTVIDDECIQEKSKPNNLRSLIYLQDAHMYTHWGHSGSIIF